MKAIKTVLITSLFFGLQAVASDFAGVWKPKGQKKGARTIFTLDKDGTFDSNVFDDMDLKCDELSFTKKEMGILKRGQVSDAILICQSKVDGDMGVISLNYLNSKKDKVVFRNIEDGDEMEEMPELMVKKLKEASNNGDLKEFVIKEDNETATCRKHQFKKSVDAKIWNSDITYFCEADDDPDTNLLMGFSSDMSQGHLLYTQDQGEETDIILVKML